MLLAGVELLVTRDGNIMDDDPKNPSGEIVFVMGDKVTATGHAGMAVLADGSLVPGAEVIVSWGQRSIIVIPLDALKRVRPDEAKV